MPAEDAEKKRAAEKLPAEESPKKEKKGPNPMVQKAILGGIIAGIIVIEAIVALFIVKATRQEDPRQMAEQKAKEQEESSRLKMTTIGMTTEPLSVTVNLASANLEEERYVKVGIQIEFDNLKYPELAHQLEARIPKTKNIMIEQLTSMNAEELLSPNGKLKLRMGILREINKTLPKDVGEVRDIFLSEFIVQ